jgi:hypothetical protein
MRGNSRDYDVWESEFGAKDWRWEKEGEVSKNKNFKKH